MRINLAARVGPFPGYKKAGKPLGKESVTLTTIAPILPPFTGQGATVASLSVREAARRFDVSRPTLVKHLKIGKLSGSPVDGGGWLIDPAEMVRAGYVARAEAVKLLPDVPGKLTTIAPIAGVNDGAEIAGLRAALAEAETRAAVAEALAEERAGHIEDLRRMLPAPDAKPKRSWWPF